MNLKSYIDLYRLLEIDSSSREERRSFGLENGEAEHSPLEQIVLWTESRMAQLKVPSLGDRVSSYLYGVTLTLVIVAFLLGLLSGIGLLSYSGHEPVNLIYFMAMVVLLPLMTMALALISMLRANSTRSTLVHISPAFWMERILALLPSKTQNSLRDIHINPLLTNWLIIQRSQLLALALSVGLLVSLVGIVTTRDIAFAWSTTLSISPEEFHTLLHSVAFAWRDLLPWAVPSVELVEQSQYFRLGEKLDIQMVENASKLGEWWKFLAISTLFYAIVLRLAMWLVSRYASHRAVVKSIMSMDGVSTLLSEINEPIISTMAVDSESSFTQDSSHYEHTRADIASSYSLSLGWSISMQELHLLQDSMGITTPKSYDVGGTNTLAEDTHIISQSSGDVVLLVKSWEPPTMDFVDFVEELTLRVDSITILPFGMVEDGYVSTDSDLDIWARKLQSIKGEKIWLKR